MFRGRSHAKKQPLYLKFCANRFQTEKIFAINLPERVDKRDNIVLASAVSGIRVEWIDGLAPENLSPTIYPFVSSSYIRDNGKLTVLELER